MILIKRFVNAITSPINKSDVELDLSTSISEISEGSNFYLTASTLGDLGKFSNKNNVKLNEEFYRWFNLTSKDYKLGNRKHFFKDVSSLLGNAAKNGGELQSELRKVNTKVISTSAIALNTANILRSVPHYSFMAQYAIRLLNYITATETDSVNKLDMSNIPAVEVGYLLNNMKIFAELLTVYGKDPKKFKDTIYGLSSSILTSGEDERIDGLVKGDSQLVGGVANNFLGNPIYTLGTIYNTWLDSRYKKMQDSKRLLELRLNFYESSTQGTYIDDDTKNEMEFLQNKINSLTVKMHRIKPESED